MAKAGFWATLVPMTDEQAIWRVQTRGDEQAFAHLVARWEEPILRLCSRLMGDVHRGEDLKQETFAKAFARRRDFRLGSKFSTWLWQIALNLCYDELRKRRSRPDLRLADVPTGEAPNAAAEGDEIASDEPGPGLQAAAREESALTQAALLQLSDEHRVVLVLRYCEGLKLREIAEILGQPETTIASRVATGLDRLSRLLGPALSDPNSPRAPARGTGNEYL